MQLISNSGGNLGRCSMKLRWTRFQTLGFEMCMLKHLVALIENKLEDKAKASPQGLKGTTIDLIRQYKVPPQPYPSF